VSLRPGDMAWADFLAAAPPHGNDFCAHVADAYDVTNILFSSGTTGQQAASLSLC
jgi:acyl-coenzyme A synthetase/AMP-(fatty) acid ligase